MKNKTDARKRGLIFLFCLIASCLSGFISFLTGPVGPFIAESFGYGTNASIVILLTCFNLVGYLIGSLLSGVMTRRFTVKHTITGLIGCGAVASLILAFVGNFIINDLGVIWGWVFFSVGNFVNGYAFGAIIACYLFLLTVTYKPLQKDDRITTFSQSGFSVGAGVGVLISGVIVNAIADSSWYLVFYITSALFLLVFVIFLFINLSEKEMNEKFNAYEAALAKAHMKDHSSVQVAQKNALYKSINTAVLLGGVALLVYLIMQGYMAFWIANLLTNDGVDKNSSVKYAQFAVSMYWFALAIAQISYGILYKQVNKRIKLWMLLCVQATLMITGISWATFTSYNAASVLIASFVAGLGSSLLYPMTYKFSTDKTRKVSAHTSAVLNSGASVGIIMSSVLNYAINTGTNSYVAPYYLALSAFVVYILVVFLSFTWFKIKNKQLLAKTTVKNN